MLPNGRTWACVLSQRRDGGRWGTPPHPAPYGNAIVETSLPSVILLVASHYAEPSTVFGGWPAFLYFIFILAATLRLNFALPMLTGAVAAAERGVRTGGDARNRDYVAGRFDSVASPAVEALCLDPQTSGGLLAAVDPAAVPEFLKPYNLRLIEDVGNSYYQEKYLKPRGRKLVVSEGERVARAVVSFFPDTSR